MIHVISPRLFGTKALPESMLTYTNGDGRVIFVLDVNRIFCEADTCLYILSNVKHLYRTDELSGLTQIYTKFSILFNLCMVIGIYTLDTFRQGPI